MGRAVLQCDECSLATPYKNVAVCHWNTVHCPPHHQLTFHCDDCSYTSKQRGHLIAHWQSINGHLERLRCLPRARCDNCDATFSKRGLSIHWAREHGPGLPRLSCDDCGHATTRAGHLFTHWQGQHSTRPRKPKKTSDVICDICNRVLRGFVLANLRRHLRTRHQFWPFELNCDSCRRQFAIKSDFWQHWLRIHSRAPKSNVNWTCDKCLRDCATRQSLTSHWLRVHAGKAGELNARSKATLAMRPPFICDNCNCSLKLRGDFIKHSHACH